MAKGKVRQQKKFGKNITKEFFNPPQIDLPRSSKGSLEISIPPKVDKKCQVIDLWNGHENHEKRVQEQYRKKHKDAKERSSKWSGHKHDLDLYIMFGIQWWDCPCGVSVGDGETMCPVCDFDREIHI